MSAQSELVSFMRSQWYTSAKMAAFPLEERIMKALGIDENELKRVLARASTGSNVIPRYAENGQLYGLQFAKNTSRWLEVGLEERRLAEAAVAFQAIRCFLERHGLEDEYESDGALAQRIARHYDLSASTVKAAIDRLKEAKVFDRFKRAVDGDVVYLDDLREAKAAKTTRAIAAKSVAPPPKLPEPAAESVVVRPPKRKREQLLDDLRALATKMGSRPDSFDLVVHGFPIEELREFWSSPDYALEEAFAENGEEYVA